MQEVLDSYQSLVGYHDLILHKYGPNKMFATVDVEVDARWDLIEAHRVIDSIEKEFDERFGIKLVGHLDPEGLDDDEQNEVYANVKRTLKSYKEDFHFHDLRLEDEKVIFDITVPGNIQMSDEELYQIIVKDLSKVLQDYEIRIHFDRNYFLKE